MSSTMIDSQKILLLSLLLCFNARGKGLRALKTQGTCKIDHFCNMKVSDDTVTGKVVVSHCNYHSGHDLTIFHIKISTETKIQLEKET